MGHFVPFCPTLSLVTYLNHCFSLGQQGTLNQEVEGSNPSWPTKENAGLADSASPVFLPGCV